MRVPVSSAVTGAVPGEEVREPPDVAAPPSARRISTILKNAFAAFVVVGSLVAVETGYFSNDRTSRGEWDEMERLKAAGKPTPVYETKFDRDVFANREYDGIWGFYNEATKDTASVENGALEVRYTSAWIGAEFRHLRFAPNAVYRVVIEAKVEEQAGAILMRNRQLDLMREQIPVTDGAFKTFSYVYVAPNGRFDQVRLILMPDDRKEVKGRMTIRTFRIERLGG